MNSNFTRDDLRAIAMYQKGIIFCIVIYAGVVASRFFIPEALRPILLIPAVCIALVSTVLVFLLALKLYGTVGGIVLGVLTLIPCIGLLALVSMNSRATVVLKANRVRVGFLGARMSDLDSPYLDDDRRYGDERDDDPYEDDRDRGPGRDRRNRYDDER